MLRSDGQPHLLFSIDRARISTSATIRWAVERDNQKHGVYLHKSGPERSGYLPGFMQLRTVSTNSFCTTTLTRFTVSRQNGKLHSGNARTPSMELFTSTFQLGDTVAFSLLRNEPEGAWCDPRSSDCSRFQGSELGRSGRNFDHRPHSSLRAVVSSALARQDARPVFSFAGSRIAGRRISFCQP